MGPQRLQQSLTAAMQKGKARELRHLSYSVIFIYLIILYWSEGICNESSIIALSYALPREEESSLNPKWEIYLIEANMLGLI